MYEHMKNWTYEQRKAHAEYYKMLLDMGLV